MIKFIFLNQVYHLRWQDPRADSYRYAVTPAQDEKMGRKGKKAKKKANMDELKQELEMVSISRFLDPGQI